MKMLSDRLPTLKTYITKPLIVEADRIRGREYYRVRKRIMRRDGHLCRRCSRLAQEIDHILPLSDGGSESDINLQALCHDCHAEKTTAENNRRNKQKKENPY